MTFMKGMSMKDLKKHPSLIPIFVIMGGASLAAVLYTFRLATKNPDVAWSRGEAPHERYRNKQYKFIAIDTDCEKEDASKAPKIEEILKS